MEFYFIEKQPFFATMLVLTADKLRAFPAKDLSKKQLIDLYYELTRNPANFEMIMIRAGHWKNDLTVAAAKKILNLYIWNHPENASMRKVVQRILASPYYL